VLALEVVLRRHDLPLALDARQVPGERVDQVRLDRVLDDGEAVPLDAREVMLEGVGLDGRLLCRGGTGSMERGVVSTGEYTAHVDAPPPRPHVLGIDDGPFEKYADGSSAPVVGVTTEAADLVESIAITRFPVDGDGVTDFLAQWITGLRVRPALQGVLFSGITLAGLAVLEPRRLAERLALPVVVVNRKPPVDAPLRRALLTAGHPERAALLDGVPEAFEADDLLHAAVAGASSDWTRALLARTRGKSDLPEALRLAHMIARALETGESRGRA
jgi:endonuclease V-like protein UPF0215 family